MLKVGGAGVYACRRWVVKVGGAGVYACRRWVLLGSMCGEDGWCWGLCVLKVGVVRANAGACACVYVCMCVHVCACVYVCVCACVYVCMCMVCMYVCM